MIESIKSTNQILTQLETAFKDQDFIYEIKKLLDSSLPFFNQSDKANQYYEIYFQFATKIGFKLEAFKTEQNLSEEISYEYCKEVYDKDPHSLTCFEYILAASDYSDFCEMMLKRKNLQE